MPTVDFKELEKLAKLPPYQRAIAKGICPACVKRKPEEGRTRCAKCRKNSIGQMLRYRKKHTPKYNAYMRAYMRAYRAKKAKPQAPNPLVAKALALQEALHAARG